MLIPIIIPAYEPDDRLLKLLDSLKTYPYGPVIIVNDGSGPAYDALFSKAKTYANVILLAYPVNKGKGGALKTGFAYVLKKMPDAIGVVTADSDGQHLAKDITRVALTLSEHPDKLVLGSREISGEDIPWKSRFGNSLTRHVFHLAAGVKINDTQTGLRGIPVSFLNGYLAIKENRFEYEMRMLLSTDRHQIMEIPITTIYDSAAHHQTHFDPLKDSIRIYKVLLGQFLKYLLSSLSSSVIDLSLFALFERLLARWRSGSVIMLATILARLISATYNFLMNHKVVYHSQKNYRSTSIKYILLAITQMLLSGLLTTGGKLIFSFMPALVIKMIVDTLLFFASYYIQKYFVF